MKKIQHMVLVKFAASKIQRAPALLIALQELKKLMPGFLAVCGGPYSSPEGLNKGFTHGYLMTFTNATARNEYLTHPEHEKLKAAFLPDLEDVVAFDFEVDQANGAG